MTLEVTGIIEEISATVQVSEKFKKREFVLALQEEINGNLYTNYAKMQLVQSKCDIIESYRKGEKVTVKFNIKGNKIEKPGAETKYITNLDAWRIERVAGQQAAPPPQQPQYATGAQYTPPENYYAPSFTPGQSNDDLPF